LTHNAGASVVAQRESGGAPADRHHPAAAAAQGDAQAACHAQVVPDVEVRYPDEGAVGHPFREGGEGKVDMGDLGPNGPDPDPHLHGRRDVRFTRQDEWSGLDRHRRLRRGNHREQEENENA